MGLFSISENVKSTNKGLKTSFDNKPIHGKIAQTIVTGENSKNSIVYLTIKWAFITGTIISTLVIINTWLFRNLEKVPDLIGDLVNSWGILTPIITLALGYAFGKSEK